MNNPTKSVSEVPEVAQEQVQEEVAESRELQIDQGKLDLYVEKLRLEQNLPLGIAGGAAAAVVAAILWATITVTTEYQIGWMAVGLGFVVGYAVRFLGKGIDKSFGIFGAALALFGCLLGNFLSIVGFVSAAENISFMETLAMIDYALVPDIMIESFSPMDIFFYGIAVYEGYQFSFRKVTEEEILQNAV